MHLAFVDVNDPRPGTVGKGIMHVLYGEASQYLYAQETALLLQRGAGGVAIAHGLDVTKDGGKARMAFVTNGWYNQMEGTAHDIALDEGFPNISEDGKPVKNIIYINRELYVRNDKNCVPCDQFG